MKNDANLKNGQINRDIGSIKCWEKHRAENFHRRTQSIMATRCVFVCFLIIWLSILDRSQRRLDPLQLWSRIVAVLLLTVHIKHSNHNIKPSQVLRPGGMNPLPPGLVLIRINSKLKILMNIYSKMKNPP